MVTPPGFEPEIGESKSPVLPLHYGAVGPTAINEYVGKPRTTRFLPRVRERNNLERRAGIEPTFQDLQSCA